MAQSMIQPSFAGGELAPALSARVDLAKYHVGAKCMRNFFVQISGGAANRPGTAFVGRARDSSHPVRLIPFQFSTLQTYVLEFGHQYMRVIMDGGYVLEPAVGITGISQANPGVVTYAASTLTVATPNTAGVTASYAPGDQVTLAGGTSSQPAVVSVSSTTLLTMTLESGGSGYAVGDTVTLAGGGGPTPAVITVAAVSSGAVTSFTIPTPGVFTANADTFTQGSTSGSGTGVTFTAPLFAPLALAVTQGGVYSAAPANPMAQASTTSTGGLPGAGAGLTVTGTFGGYTPYAAGDWVYLATVGGMTQINSTAATVCMVGSVSGSSLTLTTLDGVPINTAAYGAYTSGGTLARVFTLATPYAGSDLALLKYTQSADVMTLCHPSYAPLDLSRTEHWAWDLTAITFRPKALPPASVSATAEGSSSTDWYYSYVVTTVLEDTGEESLPSAAAVCQNDPLDQDNGITNSVSWSTVGNAASYNVYKAPVGSDGPIPDGAIYGYIGATSATSFDDANISPDTSQTPPQGQNPFAGGNNPGCVTYFQQRKIFAGSSQYPETLWMTQTGNFANMDVSSPSKDDDAITATVATCQVNSIRHLVSVNALLALTASGAFQISGGGEGSALTPTQTVVTSQAYTGCNDVPPLVINYDILYVQSKGSTVRDLSYNFYVEIYTGSDITVLSNHLFFGYQITDWCWAEEPFKLVWAVRNDGVLLCLTYLKEQDIYAWSHHDTAGQFTSTACVPEGSEDAVYFVVTRTIPGVAGGQSVQYVERLASRNFLTNGSPDLTKTWFVDCGLKYQGTPTATVTGLNHLEGATVSILADGNVQPQQVVSGGQIALQRPASTVIVGLPYTADLATLDIDAGEPTVQGKRKKVSAVTLRLENSRGLKVGPDSSTLVEIKERSSQPYGQAIPLTTCDERVLLPPGWNTQGSVWIRQDNPLPATVLGVIPEVRLGDAPG